VPETAAWWDDMGRLGDAAEAPDRIPWATSWQGVGWRPGNEGRVDGSLALGRWRWTSIEDRRDESGVVIGIGSIQVRRVLLPIFRRAGTRRLVSGQWISPSPWA